MIKFKIKFSIIILSTLLVSTPLSVFAGLGPTENPATDKGPNSNFKNNPVSTIGLPSQQLNLSLPILSLPGRGLGVDIGLVYNSDNFRLKTLTDATLVGKTGDILRYNTVKFSVARRGNASETNSDNPELTAGVLGDEMSVVGWRLVHPFNQQLEMLLETKVTGYVSTGAGSGDLFEPKDLLTVGTETTVLKIESGKKTIVRTLGWDFAPEDGVITEVADVRFSQVPVNVCRLNFALTAPSGGKIEFRSGDDSAFVPCDQVNTIEKKRDYILRQIEKGQPFLSSDSSMSLVADNEGGNDRLKIAIIDASGTRTHFLVSQLSAVPASFDSDSHIPYNQTLGISYFPEDITTAEGNQLKMIQTLAPDNGSLIKTTIIDTLGRRIEIERENGLIKRITAPGQPPVEFEYASQRITSGSEFCSDVPDIRSGQGPLMYWDVNKDIKFIPLTAIKKGPIVSRFEYDNLGNITKTVLPTGGEERYYYDKIDPRPGRSGHPVSEWQEMIYPDVPLGHNVSVDPDKSCISNFALYKKETRLSGGDSNPSVVQYYSDLLDQPAVDNQFYGQKFGSQKLAITVVDPEGIKSVTHFEANGGQVQNPSGQSVLISPHPLFGQAVYSEVRNKDNSLLRSSKTFYNFDWVQRVAGLGGGVTFDFRSLRPVRTLSYLNDVSPPLVAQTEIIYDHLGPSVTAVNGQKINLSRGLTIETKEYAFGKEAPGELLRISRQSYKKDYLQNPRINIIATECEELIDPKGLSGQSVSASDTCTGQNLPFGGKLVSQTRYEVDNYKRFGLVNPLSGGTTGVANTSKSPLMAALQFAFEGGINIIRTIAKTIIDILGNAVSLFKIQSIHANLELYWQETTSLPDAIRSHSSIFANGYVYVMGGYVNGKGEQSSVFYAKMNTNGTLSTWKKIATLPKKSDNSSYVVANSYLYMLGGGAAGSETEVYFALLNADGSIGEWKKTVSLPKGVFRHSSLFVNGYIYVIGGSSTELVPVNPQPLVTADVLYASVNTDGTISQWKKTTSLPRGRAFHTSIFADGDLYVIGGSEGINASGTTTEYTDKVFRASMNRDGTIGPWRGTTPLRIRTILHSSFFTNNHIYVIGGMTEWGVTREPTKIVWYGPVGENGVIGINWWDEVTPLPSPRYWHTSVFGNGYAYVFGGIADGENKPTASVLYAKISNSPPLPGRNPLPTPPPPPGGFSIPGYDNSYANNLVRGNVTSVSHWRYDPILNKNDWISAFNVFDIFGNVVKTSDNEAGNAPFVANAGIQCWTIFEFGYQFAYPVKTANCLNQSTTQIYDFNTGRVQSATDLNGHTISYTYDNIGRPKSVSYPDGGSETYSYDDTPGAVKLTSNSNGIISESLLNGIGLNIKSIQKADNDISVEILYDKKYRVDKMTNPHFTSESPVRVSNFYDALDRVIEIQAPDGSKVKTKYQGNVVTTYDPQNREHQVVADSLGRSVVTFEPNPDTGKIDNGAYKTDYVYDVQGKLIKVTNAEQSREFTYDSLGRLIKECHPEYGPGCMNYVYDAHGNILESKDPKGVIKHIKYDKLNRLTEKTYENDVKGGTPPLKLFYDESISGSQSPRGNLSRAEMGNVKTSFVYDIRGRIIEKSQIVGISEDGESREFSSKYEYNKLGNITKLIYPTQRILSYGYDSVARPKTLNDQSMGVKYADVSNYNAKSQVQELTLGQNIKGSFSYNNLLQLTKKSYSAASQLLSLGYTYSEQGKNDARITAIKDDVNSKNSQNYLYDALNRLTKASASGWNLSWTYDRYGNRLSQTGSNAPSISTPVNTKNNRLSGASYDANGNQLKIEIPQVSSSDLTYDSENRLVQAKAKDAKTGKSVTEKYVYDHEGQRIVTVTQDDKGNTVTYTIRDIGGNVLSVFEKKPEVFGQ
ncbi:MAG: hypothetical protein HYW77_01815 [Parcubacteria group bacterium]|nr:hypothetical protein [Parcubacteria group bacterium]